MKFTLPWLKDYLDTNADLPAILEAMTQAGLEVEDAHDPKDALKQFTVCRIVSAAQHPNADKLQVCQVETVDGMKEIVCPMYDQAYSALIEDLAQRGMLEDTLVIVSADHGGHNHNHSGALASDREIPWIAAGPRVRKGYHIHSVVSTMDTAATALMVLGLQPLTKLTGKPVSEIFQ